MFKGDLGKLRLFKYGLRIFRVKQKVFEEYKKDNKRCSIEIQ